VLFLCHPQWRPAPCRRKRHPRLYLLSFEKFIMLYLFLFYRDKPGSKTVLSHAYHVHVVLVNFKSNHCIQILWCQSVHKITADDRTVLETWLRLVLCHAHRVYCLLIIYACNVCTRLLSFPFSAKGTYCIL